MAYLIDQIDNSGLFAQSAYSAGIATYDSLGNEITATYLTGVDLTPYQTTAGMTAYQPVGDYATTSQITELSGAIDYVSANAADQEVDSLVHTNSATWDSVTNKLDTTAFSDVSGTFLTAHQDLSDYQTTAGMVDYQTTAGMTAYQSAGDYATTNDLEQVSAAITATIPSTAGLASESYVQTNSAVLTGMIDNKLDTTSFSNISGSFLTAHQDLSDYATTADLALKQDTLTFGYDEQNKISAINNSALAGGGGTTYTSPSGTILINGNTLEATKSAIATVGSEGFVSSFGNKSIGPKDYITTYISWNNSLPNTEFNFVASWPSLESTITYSANTNLTGEITARTWTEFVSIPVPMASSLNIWSNNWFEIRDCVASAASHTETEVKELAWTSELPTTTNTGNDYKIGINGVDLYGTMTTSAGEPIYEFVSAGDYDNEFCSGTDYGLYGDENIQLTETHVGSISSCDSVAFIITNVNDSDFNNPMMNKEVEFTPVFSATCNGIDLVVPLEKMYFSKNTLPKTDGPYSAASAKINIPAGWLTWAGFTVNYDLFLSSWSGHYGDYNTYNMNQCNIGYGFGSANVVDIPVTSGIYIPSKSDFDNLYNAFTAYTASHP